MLLYAHGAFVLMDPPPVGAGGVHDKLYRPEGKYNLPAKELYHNPSSPVQVYFLYSFFHIVEKVMNVIDLKIGAAYIRVSTHMQDELSPDAQKRLILDYAKKNNIVIPEKYIFVDVVSGRKAEKRPEFMRMISLAKQKPAPFEIILVWKYSRFARNQEESIVYKSLLRKQCKVDVESVSEPMMDGPFGSLIERIIEWMDEYYSIRLSGEVTRGMTEKALRGGYMARPPLGYRIPQKGSPPVIVPEEAELIRLIYDKYVNESYSLFTLAQYLNARGYKTSHGKSFERRSLEYILQNPVYCGMTRWYRTHNETNEIRDKSEWIIAQGHHEPIISKELFDAAQERFQASYQPRGARPAATYRHWLSGLVKCPICGRTMIAKTVSDKRYRKKYCYFVCYGYTKGKCLTSASVSSKTLEPEVMAALKEALSDSSLTFEVKRKVDVDSRMDEISLLRKQYDRIAIKEERIKEAYRNEVDTLEEYRENKALLEKEKRDLLTKIEGLTSEKVDHESTPEHMQKLIQSVYDILISDQFTDQQKSEALHSIIEKIVWHKEEKLAELFYYYI